VRESIYAKRTYAVARPSVYRLSVCPSVRHTGGSVKTAEVRIMQFFSPYSSLIPLVFAR